MVHHLFSRIPHYHLRTATNAIIPVLGPYYHLSKHSLWGGMKVIWNQCVFIPDAVEAAFFAADWEKKLGDTSFMRL